MIDSMADESISFPEGLGFKTQDSNELRRKQKITSDNHESLIEIPVGKGSSSLPQQPAKQEWVQVWGRKLKAVQDLSNQRETEPSMPISSNSGAQPSVSDNTSVFVEQVRSDSEEELLDVLEKVVSSVKEAELVKVAASLEDGKLHQISCTDLDINTTIGELASINSLPKAKQSNPKPRDLPSAQLNEKASIAKQTLSKSTQKKLREQIKEQALCSFSSGGK
ncbi:hypothetical protein RHSIM_Rhsim08G0140100 [Rhododendron simsii]|uniref:Uncharacterized protein n=1 Tax=Rhododendron simsii TaxID=118357 RepID=A0A834GPS9_RHOSS|nr:hypothetical protein RHSIM_Rhsim08G0140100 [Rhododendron simsii]